jgi:hypothetical protein
VKQPYDILENIQLLESYLVETFGISFQIVTYYVEYPETGSRVP